jgi:hypothetical protein
VQWRYYTGDSQVGAASETWSIGAIVGVLGAVTLLPAFLGLFDKCCCAAGARLAKKLALLGCAVSCSD